MVGKRIKVKISQGDYTIGMLGTIVNITGRKGKELYDVRFDNFDYESSIDSHTLIKEHFVLLEPKQRNLPDWR